MDDQNKNLILATVLSMAVIFVWMTWFAPEEPIAPEQVVTTQSETADGATPAATPNSDDSAVTIAEPAAPQALIDAPRAAIETPRLSGSISLLGGPYRRTQA